MGTVGVDSSQGVDQAFGGTVKSEQPIQVVQRETGGKRNKLFPWKVSYRRLSHRRVPMKGVSHERLSHWKLPTGEYGTLIHNSALVRLSLWIGVLVKCPRRTTRATSNRVAACNGIEASAGRRRRLTVLPEARLWSGHLHETRLGAGRQHREEGTLGNVSLDVTDTHMSDKVPRGEKENWSLETGGLWRDRKHSVWGPGVSLDDWRPENRSVWVS